MCARLTLATAEETILAAYDTQYAEDQYRPSWNTAPGMTSSVITAEESHTIHNYHFGLVPHWAQDKKIGYNMVNARVETMMEKPSFKPLMAKNKRCLVLADGFYEWRAEGKIKQPYRFVLPDRPVFAFAGLWSQWMDTATNKPYRSFAIITTQPNQTLSAVHNRMPVILSKEEEKVWLTDGVPMGDLLGLGTTQAQTAQATTAKQTTTTHMTKSGKPDMRYNENKAAAGAQTTTPAGPTKKDGTADMRYKANKTTKTTTVKKS